MRKTYKLKVLQESLIIERLFSLSLLFEKLGFQRNGFNLNYSGHKCALFFTEENFNESLANLLKGLENHDEDLWLKGVFKETTQILNGGIYKHKYFEPFGNDREQELDNLLTIIQQLEKFTNKEKGLKK